MSEIYNNIWDDDGIIFFIRSLRGFSAAQSLASLMNSLDKMGKKLYLVTQSQPSGDDYVSCDSVKWFAIDVYETAGYSTEEAFFKIISEIPAKTVVFAGNIYAKTLQCFKTAQQLGRCTVLYLDRSPYYYVGTGSETLALSCLYMVRNSDGVITNSESDLALVNGLGAKKACFMPYFYPYYAEEIGAAEFKGGRIVYYSTYAGRNARRVLSVFARLHEKYPESSLTIAFPGVKKNEVLKAFTDEIEGSSYSEYVKAETNIIKPLHLLRNADISLTYSHLIYMPETVMESVCAGIPAVNLQDGDYSSDSCEQININISDEDKLYQTLEYYMDKANCQQYSKKARASLDVEYRKELAKKWVDFVDEVKAEYENTLSGSLKKLESLCAKVNKYKNKSEAVKALKCEGIAMSEIFAALVCSGESVKKAYEDFCDCDILTSEDVNNLEKKMLYLQTFDSATEEKYKSREIIYADIIPRLSACGMNVEQISRFYKNVRLDERQCAHVLLNNITYELGIYAVRLPLDNSAVCGLSSPDTVNALNAFRGFILENAGFLRNKRFKLMYKTINYLDWFSKPYKGHSVAGRILLFPARCWFAVKRAVQNAGRRSLLKRKVVEITPEDVRKIQLMVLKLTLEFERICKKHGLRYYFAGGSILGGVRHKGFIPWDDDIDITMPRPDYDKFLKIAKKELSDEFKLDKDCVPFCHNRIEYKDSHFDTFWRNGGIFLDILALEGSPDDEKERRKHEKMTRFWRFWMLEKVRPLVGYAGPYNPQRVFLQRLIARMIPRKLLKWRWNHWAKKYSCDDCSSWVCLPASIYTYEQERFPKEYWGDPVPLEFEGFTFPTMSHWEDYLICHFGNYMKLPPETLRKSHHFIYRYSLGKYADIPIEEMEAEIDRLRIERGKK